MKSYRLFDDTPDLGDREKEAVKLAKANGHKLGGFVTIKNGKHTFRTAGCLSCGTGVTVGVDVMVGDCVKAKCRGYS